MSFSPIRCCDRECALVNHCSVGGIQCADCGGWFCADDINYTDDCKHICDDCLTEREERAAEEEAEEEIEEVTETISQPDRGARRNAETMEATDPPHSAVRKG